MADPEELRQIYANRFEAAAEYRRAVWGVLTGEFFQRLIPPEAAVLDLGCGYGEFINNIRARVKYAMDLNPATRRLLVGQVELFEQDCSCRWPLDTNTLDVVFTSNFFEHLPDKPALGRTLDEIARCLKPGGKLIAMGPNIKFTGGKYWDFWDHYVALTEASLSEAVLARGFRVDRCHAQFLPYSMAGGPRYPLWMLRTYLLFPALWRIAGQQFLLVAVKEYS